MFCGKSREEFREISFEIGMLGRHWLDINNPRLSPCPAGAVGVGLLGAGAGVHHV